MIGTSTRRTQRRPSKGRRVVSGCIEKRRSRSLQRHRRSGEVISPYMDSDKPTRTPGLRPVPDHQKGY